MFVRPSPALNSTEPASREKKLKAPSELPPGQFPWLGNSAYYGLGKLKRELNPTLLTLMCCLTSKSP